MEKYFGQPLFPPPVKVPEEARDSLSKLAQKVLGRCPFESPGGHLGMSTSGPLNRILQEFEKPHHIPRHLDTAIPPALSSFEPSNNMSSDDTTTTHGAIDIMKPQIQSANGHSGIIPSKNSTTDDRLANLSQKLDSTDTTRATNVAGPGPRVPTDGETRQSSQSVEISSPLMEPPSTGNSGFYWKLIEIDIMKPQIQSANGHSGIIPSRKSTIYDGLTNFSQRLDSNNTIRAGPDPRLFRPIQEETTPYSQSVEKSTNPPPKVRILQDICITKPHNIPRHLDTPIPPALSSYKPSTTMSSDGRTTTTNGAIDIMKPQIQSANGHSGIIPSKNSTVDDRLANLSQKLDSTDTTRATNVAGPGPRVPTDGETRQSSQSVEISSPLMEPPSTGYSGFYWKLIEIDIMKPQIQSANGHSGIIPSRKSTIYDGLTNFSQRLDSNNTIRAGPDPRLFRPIQEETTTSSQSVEKSTNPPPKVRILQDICITKPHNIPRHLDTPIPPALSSYKPSTTMSSDGRTTTHGAIDIMKPQIQSANVHSGITPSKKPKIDGRPTNLSQRLDSNDTMRATNVARPGRRGPIDEKTRPSSQSVKKSTNPPLKKPPSTKNPGGHLGDSTSGPLDRILQEMDKSHNSPRHLDTPIPPALSSYKPSTSMSSDGRTTTHGAIDIMKPQIQSANVHSGITPSKKPKIDGRPTNLSQRFDSNDTIRATNVARPGPRGTIDEKTRPTSQSVKKSTNPPLTKPPSTSNPGFYKMKKMPALLSPISDTCLNAVNGKKKTQTEPEVCGRSKYSKTINNPIDKGAKLKNGKLTEKINRKPSNMRSAKQFGRSIGIKYLLPLNLSEESDSEEETRPSSQSVQKSMNPPLTECVKVVSGKKKAQSKPEGCGPSRDPTPINNSIDTGAKMKNGKLTKSFPSNKNRPSPSVDEMKIPEIVNKDRIKKKGHKETASSLKAVASLPTMTDKLKNNDACSTKEKRSNSSVKNTVISSVAPISVLKSPLPNNTEKKEKLAKPVDKQKKESDKPVSIKVQIDLNKIDLSKIRGLKKHTGVRHRSDVPDNRPESSAKRKRSSSVMSMSQASSASHKKPNVEHKKDKSRGHKKRRVNEDSSSEQGVKPTSQETDLPAMLETNPEEPETMEVLKEYHSYFGRILEEEERWVQYTGCPSDCNKLQILRYRCQGLLYYKLFLLDHDELREEQNIITEFVSMQGLGDPLRQGANSTTHPTDWPNQMGTNQSTPSLSFIPLPAGSNDSVESQSSGYSSSSTDHACLNQPTAELPSPPEEYVNVPTNIFDAMERQTLNLKRFFTYQNSWAHAHVLTINGDNRDFFNALDDKLKPITTKSTLSEMAEYLRESKRRMKIYS